MALIQLTTIINAPIERVFDLARNVELHVHSATATSESAVGGVTEGLVTLGDEIEWEARHFGIRQRLLVEITAYERPVHFRDEMRKGSFARMIHDHRFSDVEGGTEMTDRFEYHAPFGVVGRAVEVVFLTQYLRRFLQERNRVLKGVAESEAWRRFLPC